MDNGLDIFKCNTFIKNNAKYLEILDILFANTQYYTKEQVLNGLLENINTFKKNRDANKKLYTLLPKSDKYGSEHYYYDIFKDLLPEHELLTEPSIVEENCEILFIDDWILSGSNFMSIFESIFYDNYCKSNGNNNKLNCVINIITFVSGDFLEYFYEVLTSYNGNLTSFLFYSYKAYLLDYYLPITINEQLKYDFCKQFSPDTNEFAYTVHFDYKIANQFGSYPEIYTYCRKTKPDKSFMIKK